MHCLIDHVLRACAATRLPQVLASSTSTAISSSVNWLASLGMHHALSVIYGIEPWVVLKDIWGLHDREVERVALWMADAVIDAALRESQQAPPRTATASRARR